MMSSLNCAQDINKLDIYTQSSKRNQYRGGLGVTSSSTCGLVHHLNSRPFSFCIYHGKVSVFLCYSCIMVT